MKMFSDCSGECCVCACSGFCLAGHGDDDFTPATKEKIIENLNEGKYANYVDYMIEHLKKMFNYNYNKKDFGKDKKTKTFIAQKNNIESFGNYTYERIK